MKYTLLKINGDTQEIDISWKAGMCTAKTTKREAIAVYLGPAEKVWSPMMEKWIWIKINQVDGVYNPGVSILCGRNIYGEGIIEGTVEY